MNESPELIGTMPSVPQPQAQEKITPSQPRISGTSGRFALFLCALCLCIFPTYAHLEELSAGVFYGIAFVILIIVSTSLRREIARRKQKAPSLAGDSKASPGLDVLRKRQRSTSIGVGIGILLLLIGVSLLVFPTEIQIGSASINVCGGSLFLVMIGIITIYVARMQQRRNRRLLAEAETQAKPGAVSASRSNVLQSSLGILFTSLFVLALPQWENMNDLIRGICYGIGLMFFMLSLLALSSAISRRMAAASQPQ